MSVIIYTSFQIHRMKQTLLIIFGLLFIALALLLPVVYSAKVVRINFGDKYVTADGVRRTFCVIT